MQKILIFLIIAISLFSCNENTKNLKIRENTDIEAFSSISSLQALQNALDDDPDNVEILYKLALWHYHKKEYSKTENYLQKAIIIEPNWKLYLLEAQSKYKSKQFAQSQKSWKEAYRLEPQALPILLFGLQSSIDLKDSILASKLISKTINIYPNNPQVYYWQGRWATTQNDTTEAFSHFTKALSFNPDLVEVYLHISGLYNYHEKSEKAILWAKKGLYLKPKYDSLLLEIAIAYQNLKEIDSAQKYYFKAYQLNNTFYKASYQLGIQAWKAGKYQEALTLFENTYRYKTDLPKINYYIGNCHEFLDKKNLAIDFYKKAIQQEPDNIISRQSLASLQQKIELIRLQRVQDSLFRVQQETERKILEEQQKQNIPN
ncbi:hypothetical protein AD998_08385 [bacterium 336/3]|nr:hypothetical protein AD998_08385 [bacterium 336/3]